MPVIVGVSWFRRKDYGRLKAMFKDGDKMPKVYDDWHPKVIELHHQLSANGFIVEKAYIDPETFPGWCLIRGMEMDVEAGIAYGIEYAAKKLKSHE